MSWISGWRRRIALAGAVALIGVGAVVLPTTFAAGDLGTGDTLGEAGILRLHLNSDGNYFRYEPDSGSPVTTNITTSSCAASVASGLVSVTVTPSTATLGNSDYSLGSKSNGEGNAQKCGQVNGPTESIKIALAGALVNHSIDRAELDIGFKYNVIVLAELRSNGTLVGTETLAGSGPDSGNDAGAADNTRWVISGVLFDSITLKLASNSPSKGAFGLEGGHDLTPPATIGQLLGTNDSIFRISSAEGVLDCGGTATETGSTDEPDATLQRLDNADGSTCEKIPYVLESSSDADSQNVHFGKDLSNQAGASFFVKVDWENETAQYPLPDAQVDEGSGPYTPQWCNGTWTSDTTFTNPSLPAGSTVHWCISKESAESAGTGQVHRITYFYGTGDPIYLLQKLPGS
jgi:hypothetical protein